MVDAILNMGMPAPIDVQVSSADLEQSYGIAEDLARQIRGLPGVGQVYIPQDMNYPALRLDVDRVHAGELGLSQKDVVDNVITALNSNLMIAPNYWVDRKTGNDYFLTVQYFENGPPAIHTFRTSRTFRCEELQPEKGHRWERFTGSPVEGRDLWAIRRKPLGRAISKCRRSRLRLSEYPICKAHYGLGNVVKSRFIQTPTEVDHYQIQRVSDVYVTPEGEDLGKLTHGDREILAKPNIPGECAGQSARNGGMAWKPPSKASGWASCSPLCCCISSW